MTPTFWTIVYIKKCIYMTALPNVIYMKSKLIKAQLFKLIWQYIIPQF